MKKLKTIIGMLIVLSLNVACLENVSNNYVYLTPPPEEEMEEENWRPAFEDLATQWPEVVARFTVD